LNGQVAALAAGDAPDIALTHDPLDLFPVDHLAGPPTDGVHARNTVSAPRAGMDLTDPITQLVLGALPFGDRWL
jgi:hypothetical protein